MHPFLKVNLPCLVALFAVTALSGCQTMRPNATAGGLFGTAAGTAVGAAIGSQAGKAGKGALIGGLAGGTMGALLGNQTDRANQRDEQNFLAAQQQAAEAAISMDQVVQMTRSGLSDDLIANQIQMNGVISLPTTNDLILLKQNGVSDRVIQSLQSARPGGRLVVTRGPSPLMMQPDVVYAAPVCPGPPMFFQPAPMDFHYFRGPRHHHHGSGVGVSFGF